MGKKTAAAQKVVPIKGPSLMEPGKGSERVSSRFVVLYGGPKVQKTGACSTLEGAKWVISDPNAIPTLDALDRLPPEEDIYEVTGIAPARDVLGKMMDVCKQHGPKGLGCTAVVVDSLTQFQDWHEQDVAQGTNQRFMGENKKEGGWQQYNAEYGAFIDDLGVLARYITVVAIAHAKEKIDGTKGDWAGLNLKPQMALKVGRTANWVLYQSRRNIAVDSTFKGDEFTRIEKDKNGKPMGVEVIIYTQPVGFWMASANAKNLRAEEPADMAELLRKEGLFK